MTKPRETITEIKRETAQLNAEAERLSADLATVRANTAAIERDNDAAWAKHRARVLHAQRTGLAVVS